MHHTFSAVAQRMRSLNRSTRRFAIIFAIIGLVATLPVLAQNAQIAGEVTDQHGKAIVGATVQITNIDTNYKTTVKTGAEGSYTAQQLPAGKYHVQVQANGFALAASDVIVLGADSSVVHDVKLQVAPAQSTVTVTGEGGSEKVGYVPEVASTTGPWGDMPELDMPYSISTTSAELMDNMIAPNTDKVFLYSPVAMPNSDTANFNYTGLDLRGFTISEVTRDGVPLLYSWLYSGTADLDRVEVLTGLSGFFYGANNVGGVLNEVSKRPTATPLSDFTVGNYGGEQMFGHFDLGGPIDKNDKFGYRLNAFTTDGDTVMQNQAIQEHILSGAFDWHVAKNLLIQPQGSWQKQHVDKPSLSLLVYGAPALPPANTLSNTDSPTYDWTYFDIHSERAGSNVTWTPSDTLTVRGGYMYYTEERSLKEAQLWLGGACTWSWCGGPYLVYADDSQITPRNASNQGFYSYVDKKFKTLGLQHKLTLGVNYSYASQAISENGYWFHEYDFYGTTQSAALVNALAAPPPTIPALTNGPTYINLKWGDTNVILGDEIVISPKWSVMAGVNHARMQTNSFASPLNGGGSIGSYDKSAFTPSASVIFKPVPRVSTYATYMESLIPGEAVPTNGNPPYTNAGSVLPPTMGRQIEVGAKANVDRVLLTAAFFDISEGSIYDQINSATSQTLTQNGREVHTGVEFTATGKVTPDLTIFGGATFFHARITKTTNTLLENQVPMWVPEQKVSMLAEYRMPFLHPLFLTGGIAYVGQQDYNAWIQDYLVWLPSYTVGDLGMRVEKKLGERRSLTGRVTVSNVADTHYWSGTAFGAPRTVACSLTTKF
jgi:iron complex outermembrane receptor protein